MPEPACASLAGGVLRIGRRVNEACGEASVRMLYGLAPEDRIQVVERG